MLVFSIQYNFYFQLLARELRMKEALEGEKAMREQIDKYTKKYNELHNSLNTSNETFEKFKREMERVRFFFFL